MFRKRKHKAHSKQRSYEAPPPIEQESQENTLETFKHQSCDYNQNERKHRESVSRIPPQLTSDRQGREGISFSNKCPPTSSLRRCDRQGKRKSLTGTDWSMIDRFTIQNSDRSENLDKHM